jgi:hypothetical protein
LEGFAGSTQRRTYEMTHYLKYYYLEKYLFEEVRTRFQRKGELAPLDLFLILNWKSPRAKNKNKDKLKNNAGGSFKTAAKRIAASLRQANSPADRLKLLMKEWSLHLPTATAILTVLYPEEFTMYDVRVCGQLRVHAVRESYSEKHWDHTWESYLKFKRTVIRKAPANLSLRDKDRYFWGKSFYHDAKRDCRT